MSVLLGKPEDELDNNLQEEFEEFMAFKEAARAKAVANLEPEDNPLFMRMWFPRDKEERKYC